MNRPGLIIRTKATSFHPFRRKISGTGNCPPGFSGIAPENTLTAFQKAIEIGSDMMGV